MISADLDKYRLALDNLIDMALDLQELILRRGFAAESELLSAVAGIFRSLPEAIRTEIRASEGEDDSQRHQQ